MRSDNPSSKRMGRHGNDGYLQPMALIVGVWALLPLTMLVLQSLGFDFGFAIAPQGEFKSVWLHLLQNLPGFEPAKAFWSSDHRNVLSPWWYIAFRPFILAVPSAPLILHLLSGLFVGLMAYLLFAELTLSRPFALSLGILSALFVADVRRDDVIWVFLFALGLSLLSIWLFSRFCSQSGTSVGYLGASYITWFLAFGTYTLQVGALAGVFLVSLRHRHSLIRSILDTLPFALLFILYLMIWITATPPSQTIANMYHLQFSFQALLNTIAAGLWNEAYGIFWFWVRISGVMLMAAVFLIIAPLIFLLLRVGEGGSKPRTSALGFALLIGICIVAPTVGVEAMSATWFPGSRWPMLLQFWSPFLFCIMTFAAMTWIPERLWWPLWRGVTAGAAAFVILMVLGFNRTQVISFITSG